jgi:hypothetical protein
VSDVGYPGPGWQVVGDARAMLALRRTDDDDPEDDLRALILMALAEAGHPATAHWASGLRSGPIAGGYVFDPPGPPADVLQRARAIALQRLGIPYTWEPIEDAP